MRQQYKNLWITSLTPEQKAGTCGYWYTVTDNFTALTAFETRKAAVTWLTSLNLKIDGELPPEGTFGTFEVKGSFVWNCVLCDEEMFDLLPGIPVAVLENARYKVGKIEIDESGQRIIHVPNPNNKWIKELNYQECRRMKREGFPIF